MTLDNAQLLVLKAAILAETDVQFVIDRTAGSTTNMANFYNQDSTFVVWKTTTRADDVFESILWKKLTPEDNPDGTAAYTNIALACQGRQFNVQTMLVGRETIASSKNQIRQGLNDALTSVPSGVAGALQAAGWSAVKLVMQRFATKCEELYATGTGTSGTPGGLVFEGQISRTDINAALAAV